MAVQILEIIIFPGFLFLTVFAMIAEYLDRILYARFQNRKGPPWFQPFADFIKLVAKEDIVPECANPFVFKLMPILALASVITASFYIPMWDNKALFSFEGDIIVIVYLLTIPTISFFLGGWYSRSLYATIGAMRNLTQLFAYEVPLFLAILSPAILAHTWSLSEMTVFFNNHLWLLPFNIIGFAVALIALLGKLEKVPFDIPEAETEIVAGSFTEYSGRLLAFFRMAIDIEMVVGASLVAAVFLPFGLGLNPVLGFILYILKVVFVIFLLALLRSVFARLRIEQMMDFCWKYLAPAAFLQIVVCVILKGVLL
ncbi:MAG: NADH-quinone oxidoreductase subunit H [Firmicutes bacterium]|nr:NADH-quinone oxidoreductase subunit H [Bacillota bacterium]